jgi:pyridoxal phosphate enzyme (YggS family)
LTQEELFLKKLFEIKPLLGKTHLLIVSKTRSLEDIKTYYKLGHRDFGENRVSELQEKSLALKEECPEIRWHMIGHLQSNKINLLLSTPQLYAIHSVHDPELVLKLIKSQEKLNHEVGIFLQFNTSQEKEKSGFESYEELLSCGRRLLKEKKLKLFGLMTMGTLRTDDFENEAQRCFQELNSLKQKLEADLKIPLQTSMGMSQDYKIALSENSDWIRLGTMMFS